MNPGYLIRAAVALPLLPLLYFQAKRVRASVPTLAAAADPAGECGKTDDPPLRIAFVGESTMVGLGARTHDEAFAGSFAQEFASEWQRRVDWHVIAKSGFSTGRVARSLVPKIPQPVDFIVAGIGGNDAFELRSPRRFRADARSLIEAIRERCGRVPIFFLGMPPIRDFPAFTPLMQRTLGGLVELLGDELHDLVSNEDSVFYDHRRITLADWTRKYHPNATAADFFSDGVHPSLLTYQTWAKTSVKWLLTHEVAI